MRPWHIFPILAPALWAGVTFGGLWPADWPEWLAEPWMTIASMALGLVLSILTSFAMADGRNPSKRVRHKPADILYEPIELVRRTLTPMGRMRLPPVPDLRVEMPDPMTEPPVARRR